MHAKRRRNLPEILKHRREVLTRKWQRNITETCYVPFPAETIRRKLDRLTEKAIAFVLSRSSEETQAESIGQELAKLHYLQPEVLSRTQRLLSDEMLAGLSAAQIARLQPRITSLLAGIAAGFFQETKKSILQEQENIRQAYISELQTKKGNLIEAYGELEKQIGQKERTLKRLRNARKTLKEKEKQLQIEARNVEEANTALKVLLEKRAQDQIELEEKVVANVKELAEPYLERLKKCGLDHLQEVYTEIVEATLGDVVTGFSQRLTSKQFGLTPTELQIAHLIRQGRKTREIAGLYNLSKRTVEVHRDHIRKKLGLNNKKTNLRTFLLSIE
jgi:DNA-binding CsgD family transcriptional regulator